MTVRQATLSLTRLQRERMDVLEELAEVDAEDGVDADLLFYDDQISRLEQFIQWPR